MGTDLVTALILPVDRTEVDQGGAERIVTSLECSNCRREVRLSQAWCPGCGAKLERPE